MTEGANSPDLYHILPCDIQNWLFKILYEKPKNLLDYEFGSYTKTVKHIGQPGDSSVKEWQLEEKNSECHNVRNSNKCFFLQKVFCFFAI